MSNLLSELTDAELQAEILRRAEVKRKEREARLQQQARRMEKVLTREVVDAFAPEHDRSSCSDETINNSGYLISTSLPRCVRCELLRAAQEGWNEEYKTLVTIYLNSKE